MYNNSSGFSHVGGNQNLLKTTIRASNSNNLFARVCPVNILCCPVVCYTFRSGQVWYKKKTTTTYLQLDITAYAVASWLVRSSQDRAVRVRALAGDIVLCSWARHFTLTVPLSTQEYKWVPANCWGKPNKLLGSDL